MPAGRPPKNSVVSAEEPFSTPVDNEVELDSSIAPLSVEALLKLLIQTQQEAAADRKAAADANAALAAAILKTTEPREILKTKQQLAVEANEKQFLDQQRELQRRQKANIKLNQDYCDHIAGGLGGEKDLRGRTSIFWHRNDVRVDVGICSVCQKIFRPSDPDYLKWRNKKSINILSAAGDHFVADPIKAQNESYLHDTE